MKIPGFSQRAGFGRPIVCVIVVIVLSVLQLDGADAKADAGAQPSPTSVFHKLRVEDHAVSQELQAKGARLVADNGN